MSKFRVAMRDDVELDLGIEPIHTPPSPLAKTNDDVARMTRPQREARLDALLADSWRIYHEGLAREVYQDGRQLAGVVSLFSGGNDSTTTTHIFREVLTHTGHAHTTVGIESTRQFVRDTSALWGLQLLERRPPRLQDQYRAQVLSKAVDDKGRPLGGFPGPNRHARMYQRLKLRAIEQMQRELVAGRGRTHRVAFIAGRRRDESRNRADVPEHERKGSRVWLSPMVHWTKLDLNTYRMRHATDPETGVCKSCGCSGIPRNSASDLIHMSGECLCGSYAGIGEREQLEQWFWEDLALIRELEAELRKPEWAFIPEHRKTWGWAGIPELAAASRVWDPSELIAKAEGLCQSCKAPDLEQLGLFDVDGHQTNACHTPQLVPA